MPAETIEGKTRQKCLAKRCSSEGVFRALSAQKVTFRQRIQLQEVAEYAASLKLQKFS